MAEHNKLSTPAYAQWLGELKNRVLQVQTKAAVSVNRDLLTFYWELGCEIIEKQQTANWGSKFLQNLSDDLITEFLEIKGFSYRNLRRIRQWVIFYSSESSNLATSCGQIAKQPVVEFLNDLVSIPWGHNGVIISKCDEKLRSERDEPTIGILLCKTKDKLIAEYALSDINKPIGVSEYQLTQSLPDSLKPNLPSIEELEAELQSDLDDENTN